MKTKEASTIKLSERIGGAIDKFIGIFSPKAAYKRTAYRHANRIMASVSHRGAGTDRLRSHWLPGGGSADEDLLPDLPTLRERSRDLNRNDAHAAGITSTITVNTVGTGIAVQSKIDAKKIRLTDDQADAIQVQCEKSWEKWCTVADAGERMDFAEIQNLIDASILENGEALIQPVMLSDRSRPYSLAIDIIEPDRLDTPMDKRSDKSIRAGVEVGDFGQPVAYWIKKTHPGDITYAKSFSFSDYVRVPAKNAYGRKNVIHIYPVKRAGQTRGVPFFTPVLTIFKDLSDYMEAELVASRVAACFAIFVKKTDAYEAAIADTSDTNSSGQRLKEIEPGMFEYLRQGEDIASFNPNRPGGTFEPFVDRILRALATGLNLPYEIVAKDFSKTNYSSARAALLQAYRYFKVRQQFLSNRLIKPIYEMVIEEAWLRGEIDIDDFYGDRYEYTRTRCIAPGWEWVDPLMEAKSSDLAIRRGLSTLADENASQGKNWEDTIEQRAREKKKIRELEVKHGVTIIEPDKTTDKNTGNNNPDNDGGEPADNKRQENNDEEN